MSAGTARGGPQTDAFDVALDASGEVCVFVVKLRGSAARRPGLLASALAVTRTAVESRLAIHELIADVRRSVLAEPGIELGLALLRFVPRDSRIEILNAGMPPILRFLPAAAASLYPELSSPIGTRFGEVHPYELSALVWGSTWAIVSDGVTGGSTQQTELTRRVAGSELERRAFELANEPSSTLERIASELAPDPGVDRTVLVVNADPRHRFESGIEPTSGTDRASTP